MRPAQRSRGHRTGRRSSTPARRDGDRPTRAARFGYARWRGHRKKRALEAPPRQLALNAGLEPGVVVESIRHSSSPTWGIDLVSEHFVDMLQAGIIDPAKVTRSARENAASVAAMILTTEALVTDAPPKSNDDRD